MTHKPTSGHFVPGDVSALAALYDRCSLVVHTVVARALPRNASPGEVDQVVEDVFWRLWQLAGADTPTMAAVISESVGRSRGRR